MNNPEIAILEGRTFRFFFADFGARWKDVATVERGRLLESPACFNRVFDDAFRGLALFGDETVPLSDAFNGVDEGAAEALFDEDGLAGRAEFAEDCSDEIEEEEDGTAPLVAVGTG